LFLITQNKNLKSIRRVKKVLANLRRVIRNVLIRHRKVREIKAQDSALTTAVV
jgi:hypothetical protein